MIGYECQTFLLLILLIASCVDHSSFAHLAWLAGAWTEYLIHEKVEMHGLALSRQFYKGV